MKNLLGRLKKKYGPLPLWAWTAIAGVGGFLYMRRKGAAGAPATDAQLAGGDVGGDFQSPGDLGSSSGTGPSSGASGDDAGSGIVFPDKKLTETTAGLRDDVMNAIDLLRQTDAEVQQGTQGLGDGTDTSTQTTDPSTGAASPVTPAPARAGGKKPATGRRPIDRHKPIRAAHPPNQHAQAPQPRSRRGGRSAPPQHGSGQAGARARKPAAPKPRAARPRQQAPPRRPVTHAPPARPKPSPHAAPKHAAPHPPLRRAGTRPR